MRQGSSQQGADPSLRLGDLTLQQSHYQTGVATRQPLVPLSLSRRLTARMRRRFRGINRMQAALAELISHGVQVPIFGLGCYVIVLTRGSPAASSIRTPDRFDLRHPQWLAGGIDRPTNNQEKENPWETSTRSTRCAMRPCRRAPRTST